MIKIYLLLLFMYLSPIILEAQFEPGQKIIGGGISFTKGKEENSSNNYTSKYTNTSINPVFGKFKRLNRLKGIGLFYGNNYQETTYTNSAQITKTNNSSIGIELFSQRFIPLATGLFFTIKTSASAGYQFGDGNGYGIGLAVAPGVSYKLTDRILFDAFLSNLLSIGYTHTETKYQTSPNTLERRNNNNFYLSSSLSNTNLGNVGLGFRWLLKR